MSKGQNILLPPNLPIFVFPFTFMSTFLHQLFQRIFVNSHNCDKHGKYTKNVYNLMNWRGPHRRLIILMRCKRATSQLIHASIIRISSVTEQLFLTILNSLTLVFPVWPSCIGTVTCSPYNCLATLSAKISRTLLAPIIKISVSAKTKISPSKFQLLAFLRGY